MQLECCIRFFRLVRFFFAGASHESLRLWVRVWDIPYDFEVEVHRETTRACVRTGAASALMFLSQALKPAGTHRSNVKWTWIGPLEGTFDWFASLLLRRPICDRLVNHHLQHVAVLIAPPSQLVWQMRCVLMSMIGYPTGSWARFFFAKMERPMLMRLHPRLVQQKRHARNREEDLRSDPSLEFTLLWRLKTQHPPSRL